MNLVLNLDFKNNLEFSIINYLKPRNSIANLSLELKRKEDKIIIKNLNLNHKKESIEINDLVLKKMNFYHLKN